jgi:MYXO-CTERM domain-containing protein
MVAMAAIVFAAVLVPAQRGAAILIDRDVYTHDTETGFFWLDLTMSTGLSFNQMLTQLQPGGIFENHRYASQAEVQDLFVRTGLPVGTFQTSLPDPTINRLLSFQNLVGVTVQNPAGGFFRTTSNGLTNTDQFGNSANVQVPFVDVLKSTTVGASLGGVNISTQGKATASGGVGSWLIRTAPFLGANEASPVLPDATAGQTFEFNNVDGLGAWFDPVAAFGFEYAITDGTSQFTTVGLPTGTADADQMFLVSDGINPDVIVAAGEYHTFDTPVTSFTVTGIDPTVDGEDPQAFPTFLMFDNEQVSFSMTPLSDAIPEPAGLAVLVLGVLALGRRRRG